ncbi:MAG: inositol-3-phosphate synthase [Patescibacteria group bacterium]
MKKKKYGRNIKVAIVGIGNCASSFIQGLEYYKDIDETSPAVPGLMHNNFGGYLIRDIDIVAAFDINNNKIGKDISEAIWVSPTNSRKFADVPNKNVTVRAGFIGDGIAPHMKNYFPLQEEPENIANILKKSGADMCVSFLPVGSRQATRFYAQACLNAGVAFINGIPEFIASDIEWAEKFQQAGIPCAGDDIQSQVGATIIHRTLVSLIRERGQTITNSYQLDIGGNMDFDNLTDRNRLSSKRISKTDPIIYEAGTTDVKVVPADYIPFLSDNKIAYINIKGKQFGGFPFEVELKMSVEDSPNNAGVMVDAVRAMKISLDRKLAGYQEWSAYFFKHPLHLIPLNQARNFVEDFIVNQ